MARKATTPVEADEVEAPTTITAKALATDLGVEAKAFRRWLRRYTSNRAGKGGRWTFTTEEAEAIKTAYSKVEVPAEA